MKMEAAPGIPFIQTVVPCLMVTSVLLSRLHWTVKCLERSSVTCESGIDTIGLGLLGHLFSHQSSSPGRLPITLSAFCFLLLPLLRHDPAEPASPPIHDQQPYLSLLAPSIRRFSTFFKPQGPNLCALRLHHRLPTSTRSTFSRPFIWL